MVCRNIHAALRAVPLILVLTRAAASTTEDSCESNQEAHSTSLLQFGSSGSRASLATTPGQEKVELSAVVPSSASMENLKESYLSLLKMAVTGSLADEAGACVLASPGGCSSVSSFDANARQRGLDWPPWGHTMVGHLRLDNVRMVIEETIANKVPGDFVELGTWRGGTCIYAKAIYNLESQTSRKVHLFDAFDKMQSYNVSTGNFIDFIAVSQESVEHNFKKYGVLDQNVQFHKGLFKDTVPAFAVAHPGQKLSVLRIDGNFYDSYQDALYYLYPMVPVGGFVIFDDVFINNGKEAIMQCWLDFKADNKLPEELTRIDDVSAYFRKTVDVPIDLKNMKAPRDANLPEDSPP